jgi:hypothetical protein
MASIMSIQVYLDQAKLESESDTKAAGVRQRAELQKIIKTAMGLRKQILAQHKKPVAEEPVAAPVSEEKKEPVVETAVEELPTKKKVTKKVKVTKKE